MRVVQRETGNAESDDEDEDNDDDSEDCDDKLINNHIDNSPAHDPSNLHVSDIEIASTISRGTTPIVLHSSSSLCPHLSTDDNTPSTPTNASVHSPKINNYNNNRAVRTMDQLIAAS